MRNEQIDGNKEIIAFGIMNIVGSFTSCYLTTGMHFFNIFFFFQHIYLLTSFNHLFLYKHNFKLLYIEFSSARETLDDSLNKLPHRLLNHSFCINLAPELSTVTIN